MSVIGPVSPSEAQQIANQGGTSAATPVYNPAITNQADFAYALLARLGISPNPGNVSAIVAWERAEGGNWNNSAKFNPLNTTQTAPGSISINGVGVQSYQSWSEGLDATVQTLRNGRYNAILNALNGTNPYTVAGAVGASPWGTPNFSNLIGSSAGSSVPSNATLAASGQPNANAGAATDDHCIIGGGGISLPLVGSVGGAPCLLGTPTARAILGATIIVGGVAVGVFGVAIIVADGLKGSALARAASPVASSTLFGRSVGPRRRAEQATDAAERSGAEQAADPEFQRQRRAFANQGRRAQRATPPPFTEADETAS